MVHQNFVDHGHRAERCKRADHVSLVQAVACLSCQSFELVEPWAEFGHVVAGALAAIQGEFEENFEAAFGVRLLVKSESDPSADLGDVTA